jgi:1-aminocyclopropane-1-carboxylate deaminase/D-cysteine desulfhydrase-like pyridoxal-dependent ACC family enzyme
MIPLFKQYPSLQQNLPYVSLTELPTPVQKLDKLGQKLGIGGLYIKRDDLSGKIYGGNKVRKLEFLLGDALQRGVKEVVTFGAAGSNHALATAIYAGQVGIKSISMLMPQPNTHYVRRNLLMSYYAGAELHLCGSKLEAATTMPMLRMATTYQLIRHRLKNGSTPILIPPGGSSPRGVIGFINAMLEFREQVLNGEIPEPDYIYVASGTMGTAIGLQMGLKLAKLNSRLVSVRVTGENFVNEQRMLGLIGKVNAFLHSMDGTFPGAAVTGEDLDIRNDFYGEQYALFTEEGMKAVSLMKEYEDIKLDGTYTGKTMAALVADTGKGLLKDKTVLFWNTLNSRDFSSYISNIDYHVLPREFHRYFEEDVQPLDRDNRQQ